MLKRHIILPQKPEKWKLRLISLCAIPAIKPSAWGKVGNLASQHPWHLSKSAAYLLRQAHLKPIIICHLFPSTAHTCYGSWKKLICIQRGQVGPATGVSWHHHVHRRWGILSAPTVSVTWVYFPTGLSRSSWSGALPRTAPSLCPILLPTSTASMTWCKSAPPEPNCHISGVWEGGRIWKGKTKLSLRCPGGCSASSPSNLRGGFPLRDANKSHKREETEIWMDAVLAWDFWTDFQSIFFILKGVFFPFFFWFWRLAE